MTGRSLFDLRGNILSGSKISMARTPDPRSREALLEAARIEFARRGLDHARVEDIARRAGVSKGAFYLHFDSKESAFRELLQRFLGVMEEHTYQRKEAEKRFEREMGSRADVASSIEFECSIDQELLEIMWRNRHMATMLDGTGDSGTGQLVVDFRRRMRALIVERLTDKQSNGLLRQDVDPEVVADVIYGAYEGYVRRMPELKQKPDFASWSRSLLLVLYEGALAQRLPRQIGRARKNGRQPKHFATRIE